MNFLPRILFALVAVILALPLGAKSAQSQAFGAPIHVGRTTTIVREVRSQVPGRSERLLSVADSVFFQENLITADGAKIVIQFRDGSTMELGPNGAMKIDELVFNPLEGQSRKVMTIVQGSFRYISGYTAKFAAVSVNTPNGTIGIRGSSVSGIIHPNIPTFVHVSSGVASFTNSAGSATINPGQSIASPSPSTPPMPPERMPAAVAAQAVQAVQQSLGAPPATQILTAAQRTADATANAIPVAQQLATAATPAVTLPLVAPAAAANIPLLSQASNVGLLTAAAPATPTAAQQSFLAAAQQAVPNASQIISEVTAADQQQNAANTQAGTAEVISGSSSIAQTPDQIAQLVEAAIQGNPAVAGLVAQTAIVSASANIDTAALAQSIQTVAVAAGVDVSSSVEVAVQQAADAEPPESTEIDSAVLPEPEPENPAIDTASPN